MSNLTLAQAILGGTLSSINQKVTDRQLSDDKYISDLGNTLFKSTKMMDLFFSGLVDRIGKVIVDGKKYKNQLADFKKDSLPYGVAVEDIYFNISEGEDYSAKSSLLLSGDEDTYPDDVRAIYYTVNSYKKFTARYIRKAIKQAFTSADNMEKFIEGLMQNLLNSQQVYEFNKTKDLIGTDFRKAIMGAGADTYGSQPTTVRIANVKYNDLTFATDLTKQIRTLALNFINPSTKYNNYSGYVSAIENEYSIDDIEKLNKKPVTTFSAFDRMHLIMRNENIADVDVDTLAVSFNLDKVDFLGKVHGVPDFGIFEAATSTVTENVDYIDNTGERQEGATRTYNSFESYEGADGNTVYRFDKGIFTQVEDEKTYKYTLIAVICDESFVQIRDTDTPQMVSFFDPSNMVESVFLHSWQSYALSPISNAVALYKREEV